MLLSITTTHHPATDLGYLLGKHPERLQSFELAYGHAHVFYPEASVDRCTACLLLDIDPIGLVRNHRGGPDDATLARYVNDRPYVASSFLSVAIARVFGSALGGVSKERPELAQAAIPLVVELAAVPSRGGERFLRAVFEPLGYEVAAERMVLDEQFPDWGYGPYLRVTLRRTARLAEVLGHVYVLLPVLDDYKHYWVGQDELEKLLDHGSGWLAAHPARDEIVRRYLKHQRRLTREALERLLADEELDVDEAEQTKEHEEQAIEDRVSLNDARLAAVCAELEASGARTVIDLGCGEGRLLSRLARAKQLARIVGVDVSPRALEIARERLGVDELPDRQRERISLFQASLTYRDARFAGFDAACAIEVIEHIEPSRLGAFERVVFEFATPRTVIITTPNAEYNAKFEALPAGKMRHRDHRFEWTRAEFERWARSAAERHGYAVRWVPIGEVDAVLGAPTQMGVFTR
ncbi:MAG TPA: 3' terminal RNA ribose 2'-O-methyltransferase Hen1 [Kofleriaceae bacterium]|nr:3' terminal RNA ribose 2'-O-methyltransferase Hen1 [Kofleriaceae bacterium]